MSKAEKYIKNFTMRCKNDLTFGGCAPWISPENALEAVNIAKEETIEKAVEWIREHYLEYPNEDCGDTKKFVETFKRAMSR